MLPHTEYYPHLMTLYGYTSRNIPSAEVFEKVLDTRLKAKADGDKTTSNALKLVVNTTYGASLDKYNHLYDPLMGRSVCITGQLFLLELANHLYKDIPDLEVVQLNTDGMMVEFDDTYIKQVQEIIKEWEGRTGFELEEDCIAQIAQEDVNNYIEVQTNGAIKTKGAYFSRGIAKAGQFNINNNAIVVAKAIQEYLINGTPVEETIANNNDIFDYQIIAKAGSKYSRAYQLVNDKEVPIQKVNRVYATSNKSLGKLYKVKAENGSVAKIESLPEHCIIDNDNHLTISDVDKTYYINLARKRINDFKGEKKMATTKKAETKMNVYQKLIKARQMFLQSDIQKTGKNMHLSFMYFELEDIVPTVISIFSEVGLLSTISFDDSLAKMTIINTDNAEEKVDFTVPFTPLQPIISNTGKQATNEMQALGSSITYMRRYLYMIAMDIVESDSIDSELGKDEPVKAKAPATPKQRQEVKEELTATENNATALQIKGLKKVLKELKDKDPSKEEMIAKIAVETKGFTEISKSDCEELIKRITEMLEEGK